MAKTQKLRHFVEHPATNLIVGIVLFMTGFIEAYDTFYEDITEANLGAHHGMMLFGVMNILSSIPDIIEGLHKSTRYFEK